MSLRRTPGRMSRYSDQFGGLVPRVADQPLVRALAGEHDFLAALVNAPGQLQQRRARRIDHRRLGGLDELRVGVHRVLRAKLLHDRWLGFDVPCDEVGRVEFVQLRASPRGSCRC